MSEQQSLILSMEKRLGRELTPAEKRLIGLAEELIASEKEADTLPAKSAASGTE